jgi:hypothetical protein
MDHQLKQLTDLRLEAHGLATGRFTHESLLPGI